MLDSVRYERGQQISIQTANYANNETASVTNGAQVSFEELHGAGTILCTHDGVLLKKASAEHISDLNTSGGLALVEYGQPRRCLYVEWRPNDQILIADDNMDQEQGEWALVDTISRRTRTTSESIAFNIKPPSMSGSMAVKPRVIRCALEELSAIEVKHRGQALRFIRKCDGTAHFDFFFQHGNADLFVSSMRKLHIIDNAGATRNGEEYVILSSEKQKLKKTFAELDIGEIKNSANESWLPNKVVGFLVNIPDLVAPPFNRSSPKQRPGALHQELKLSTSSSAEGENYQIVGLSNSSNSSINSSHQSNGSSLEKSPSDNKIVSENVPAAPLPARPKVVRGLPLTENQWLEFQTPDGRISDPTRVKEIIFRGGVQANLRAELWKYLLNYYQWDDTEVERIQRRKEKSIEYYNMKAQWLSMTTKQEANFVGYRDRKCQIEKDVKRTDRSLDFFSGEDNPNLMLLQGILMTYVMYNFDLGYVQGMSDLLAPILAIQKNEVDAFWCFVGFMEMVFANFDMDQAGMKTQFHQLRCLLEFCNPRLFRYMRTHDSDNMYFCFRWLLVWYKREFNNDDVLKLWECLWTRLPCPNFHVLISVAILDQQTDIIIDSAFEFTEILKHVNELSGNIDLQITLQCAEAIYLQIKEANELPNDIREIIGEPVLFESDELRVGRDKNEFDDGFDELVKELTPEEKRIQQEQLEEACERSMFLQYI